MLDAVTKRRIDDARDILVGKVPDPKSQVEQITIALIYKFMDDMDKESVEYGGEATFFTGEYAKYSWTKIFDPKLGGYDMLNLYSEAIDKLNHNPNVPQLFRDIFKNAYLPYRDPETLKLFLKTINEFHYDHSEKLGDAFEYLLSVLGSQGDAGQFRTPRHIIDFIVAILQPKKGETICDPACGTAGFLISAYKYILNANTKKHKGDELTPEDRKKLMQNFTGYDISPDMVRLSLANMYLHGFTAPRISEYDTLTSEERWGDYFDIILANPPFMSPKGGIKPHKRFSLHANRSEVLFADYIAEHINPTTGRAGVIVPEGIIFQSATAYKALRKMLVDKNYLYAVVSLPAGVFQPYSGVKTSILLMDKTVAKKMDNIIFVKIEADGFDLGAQRRPIEKNDLPAALIAIDDYKDAVLSGKTFEPVSDSVLVVAKEKIKANGEYNLSGERYRSIEQRNAQWNAVPLSEIAEVISGQSPEGRYYNESGEGMPFYQGRTEFGAIFIGEPKTWTTSITKVAEKGDILMSVRAPVGPVNVAVGQICIGRGIAAIRANEKVSKWFLFYYLKSIEEKIKGSGGAVFDSINRKQIEEITIPLPPLSVQQEIVTKIESYQRIIDGANQVVENYKPQIDIDPNWEMMELGEVCEVKSGGTPSRNNPAFWHGNIPWYSSGELNHLYTESSKEQITDLGIKNSNAIVYPKGSLLVGMYDTAAFKMSILDRDGAFNQAICGLMPTPEIDFVFLYLYFTMMKESYLVDRLGVRQRNLSKGYIEKVKIPVPSISIQHNVVQKVLSEKKLIDGNKRLIELFEQKIKDEINKLWQAEEKVTSPTKEPLSMVAEP